MTYTKKYPHKYIYKPVNLDKPYNNGKYSIAYIIDVNGTRYGEYIEKLPSSLKFSALRELVQRKHSALKCFYLMDNIHEPT